MYAQIPHPQFQMARDGNLYMYPSFYRARNLFPILNASFTFDVNFIRVKFYGSQFRYERIGPGKLMWDFGIPGTNIGILGFHPGPHTD